VPNSCSRAYVNPVPDARITLDLGSRLDNRRGMDRHDHQAQGIWG